MLFFTLPRASELSYLLIRKEGRRGSTERESWALTCMFLQLCPVVPVGAGVPAVIRLDQLVSTRAVPEETKRLLCHLRARCAPGWHGGRWDAPFSASCSPVFIPSVRLCVPWPSASPGSRGQPRDAAPCCAALSPGSASLPRCRGEQRQPALPSRGHAGSESPSRRCWSCCFESPPLSPLQGTVCDCRLCNRALFSFTVKIGWCL